MLKSNHEGAEKTDDLFVSGRNTIRKIVFYVVSMLLIAIIMIVGLIGIASYRQNRVPQEQSIHLASSVFQYLKKDLNDQAIDSSYWNQTTS
ncbi:MAG: hypothetical protein COB29_01150 [Sulfitobacter sp.]|nr:MAG: hypothetical protein COB29_01150 [Sulfitobacter sp.]